jgi:hypothetical protein
MSYHRNNAATYCRIYVVTLWACGSLMHLLRYARYELTAGDEEQVEWKLRLRFWHEIQGSLAAGAGGGQGRAL